MKKIIDILNTIHPEFDYISSNDFIADGYLDSFDMVALVSSLESEYAISIKGTDIIPENFYNLDAIQNLLNSYNINTNKLVC